MTRMAGKGGSSTGSGSPKDDTKAVRWYRMAAEQGHAEAQHYLGTMYFFGEGVPKNATEAVRWFRQAAKRGYVKSQYNLGLIYYEGEGIPIDNVQAYVWFSMAANQGLKLSKRKKAAVAKRMTRIQIAEARKLYREYLENYGPGRENQ